MVTAWNPPGEGLPGRFILSKGSATMTPSDRSLTEIMRDLEIAVEKYARDLEEGRMSTADAEAEFAIHRAELMHLRSQVKSLMTKISASKV